MNDILGDFVELSSKFLVEMIPGYAEHFLQILTLADKVEELPPQTPTKTKKVKVEVQESEDSFPLELQVNLDSVGAVQSPQEKIETNQVADQANEILPENPQPKEKENMLQKTESLREIAQMKELGDGLQATQQKTESFLEKTTKEHELPKGLNDPQEVLPSKEEPTQFSETLQTGSSNEPKDQATM